ncbi:MAG TPA: hypothetical protein VMM38_09625 [Aridibacter sp.]|nr:hypothetical protein [Aridibacter sp.]
MEIEELVISFEGVEYGLLEFTLALGEQTYSTRFSEVWDPIIRFKKWLEAISIGVHQCSFWFDTEGSDICFSMERRYCADEAIFKVTYAYEDDEVRLIGKVNPKQLVVAFYKGFLGFWESCPDFEDEWLGESLEDRLRKTRLASAEEIAQLHRLNRSELIDLLDKAYPIDPSIVGRLAEEAHSAFSEGGVWEIPVDYDDLTETDRKEWLKDVLTVNRDGFQGTPLSELRSEIIDRFIANDSKSQVPGDDL